MKKITALTLGSMIMMNSAAFAFSDLTEEHWAYRNVLNMQEKGIISGFEDNTFRPSETLTREQFITMAVKGLNIEKLEEAKQFEDVLADRWSADYILAGGHAMIDDEVKEFRPAEVALREDVAMAIVRFNDLEEVEYNLETLNKFSDSEEISENRKKYVAIAVENGFMSGNDDGTFSPKKALTRAEGATVIFNMLETEEEPVVEEEKVEEEPVVEEEKTEEEPVVEEEKVEEEPVVEEEKIEEEPVVEEVTEEQVTEEEEIEKSDENKIVE